MKPNYMARCLELQKIVAKRSDEYREENVIHIQYPIWKTRSIGIATDRVRGMNYIEIDYRNSEGKYVFPETYKISGERLKSYPIQDIGTKRLYIVPIAELEIYED